MKQPKERPKIPTRKSGRYMGYAVHGVVDVLVSMAPSFVAVLDKTLEELRPDNPDLSRSTLIEHFCREGIRRHRQNERKAKSRANLAARKAGDSPEF